MFNPGDEADVDRLLAEPRAVEELNQAVINEFRSNQDRVGRSMEGMPILLLTMIGAKTGRTLTRPLCYSRDGDRLVIVSSYGGFPRNQPWYHNLVTNPVVTVEVGTEKSQARAAQSSGAERQRLFDAYARLIPTTDAAATPYWLRRGVCGMRLSNQIVTATGLTKGCDAATYCVQETLRDGSGILIRAIRSDDKDRLREHARGLSSESVYHRFMGYKRALTDYDLQRFTEVDFTQHVGLVAVFSEAGSEHIIGVGRYIRTSNERAEVAFSVIDKHQGHGVGTLLLAHLSRIAKNSGITAFEADVMGDNTHMLDVIRASGFKVQQTRASGMVHLVWRIEDA